MSNSRRRSISPIGWHEVPDKLIGQNNEVVKSWARDILMGEEPKLSPEDLGRIRKGELHKVFLRPKKKGFFTEEGVFIEAFDYEPTVGEDLDEAEKKWEIEEKEREWIDGENRSFNQKTYEVAEKPILAMWEHGKRIMQYVEKSGIALYSLQIKLAKRGGEGGYGLYAHQVCTDLYLWKRDAEPDDPVFSVSWGHIDCIIRFSRENTVRDNVLATMSILIKEHGLTSNQMCFAFGTKDQDRLSTLDQNEIGALNRFRQVVETQTKLENELLHKVALASAKAVRRTGSNAPDNRTTDHTCHSMIRRGSP